MAETLLTPLAINVPLVDPETGNPTPYFQRLLQQLLKEKKVTDDLAEGAVQGDRQIISGDGLTGGGDLSADRTLNVGAGTGITVSADAVAADPEYIRDTIAAFAVAGTNMTITHDDGANTLTFDASGGGSGGLTFIQRTVVSALSTVDIPLSNSYDSFYIEYYLAPSVDSIGINLNVTDDNFATIETGATDYYYTQVRSSASSTGVSSSNGTSAIALLIGASLGNAANEFTSGHIGVINSKETAPTHIQSDISYVTPATAFGQSRGIGVFKPTSVVNGIRLTPSSGNLTGFYKIWGRSV